MKRFFFILLLAGITAGCSAADMVADPPSQGNSSTVLPSLGVGNSDTNLSIFVQGGTSLAPAPLSSDKNFSISDPLFDKFRMEVKSLRIVDAKGQRRDIPVNAMLDLADPNFASSMHFLTQDGLPAGHYKSIELEIGTVELEAKILTQDAEANLKSLAGSILPIANEMTLKAKEEVGLPLILDLRQLALDPTRVRAGLPFATRISVLEIKPGLFVWTTGDFFGLSTQQGELFEYRRDFALIHQLGRYIPISDTEGAYIITDGTYKGVQGAYRVIRGGVFVGDRRGVFRLNGSLTGGVWISTVPEVGTFSLDRGAVPNGTGRFYRLTGELLGTFNINNDVSGGTWVFTDGTGSGIIDYNPN